MSLLSMLFLLSFFVTYQVKADSFAWKWSVASN
jgi:hypothetical protein